MSGNLSISIPTFKQIAFQHQLTWLNVMEGVLTAPMMNALFEQAHGEEGKAVAQRVAAVHSFVHGAAAACPELNVKLITEQPLQQVLREVITVSDVSAGDQSKPGQPQPAAVAEVCRAVNPQRIDDLANALDALATELAPANGFPTAMLISGSTARLAAFCKLLAADAQPNEQQHSADDEALLKAWAQAFDLLGAMSLSDAVAGLRWLLHGLPCPLPIPAAAGEQDTKAVPHATPLSASARDIIVCDAATVLADTLSGAQAVSGEIDDKAVASHNGAAVADDDDARAAAVALLQELQMKMLTVDAVATVHAQCVLSEAGLSLVEAALELAAEGADGLEAAVPECLQVCAPPVGRMREHVFWSRRGFWYRLQPTYKHWLLISRSGGRFVAGLSRA